MIEMPSHDNAFRALLFLLAFLTCALSARAQTYVVTDLGTLPGGSINYPYSVNSAGTAVGYSWATDFERAFVFQGGMSVEIDPFPGDTRSIAMCINGRGDVGGISYTHDPAAGLNSLNTGDGFIYRDGVKTLIQTPPGWQYADPRGMNDSGQVAGVLFSSIGNSHAFLLSDGVLKDLGTFGGSNFSAGFGINRFGHVTGVASIPGGYHAFVYDGSQMRDIGALGSPAAGSQGFAINDRGQVTGNSFVGESSNYHAFLYSDGVMTDLGTFGGNYSTGRSINNKGQVVGDASKVTGPFDFRQHAFIYDPAGGGMRDLNDLIPLGSGWELNMAFSINDAGQIVGWGSLNGQPRGFLLTPPDPLPPVTAGQLSPAPNGAGWNNGDVDVSLGATDNEGGTGVKQITYSAVGAQTVSPTTVEGSSASLHVSAEGVTTVTYYATDNVNNAEEPKTLLVRIDKSAPSVSCGETDGLWHAVDVQIGCTAVDVGSGLADPSQGAFTLATEVPANTETAQALTGNNSVCDVAGNCAMAGPVGGNKVDKRPPSITLSVPGGNYLLNQAVAADYNCSDGGSGVAACSGTVQSGSRIDTATPGAKTFTVTAADNVGNVAPAKTVSYTVGYGVVVLYDQSRAHKSGSAIPIKIRLVDANGVNVSSPSIGVHAVSVFQIGSEASPVLDDAGQANPDFDFRFDPSLGGYIFNLKTTGYGTGTYALGFIVGSDPTLHTVQFQVRQ